jgi:hypothetical protein
VRRTGCRVKRVGVGRNRHREKEAERRVRSNKSENATQTRACMGRCMARYGTGSFFQLRYANTTPRSHSQSYSQADFGPADTTSGSALARELTLVVLVWLCLGRCTEPHFAASLPANARHASSGRKHTWLRGTESLAWRQGLDVPAAGVCGRCSGQRSNRI